MANTVMSHLITHFPDQLKESLALFNSKGQNVPRQAQNVCIIGMGGSGIGGDFIYSISQSIVAIPVVVCKSYQVPAWVSSDTLVIASSYSGNTEETIHAVMQASHKGARINVVTSGGKLKEMALANGWIAKWLPSGMPSPRACLGYSIVAQMSILVENQLLPNEILESVKQSAELLVFEQEDIIQKANKIAHVLISKNIIIYGADIYEPILMRCSQQINENAKHHAHYHVVPEMNHNEIVAWNIPYENIAVMIFRGKDEYKRVSKRMEFLSSLLNKNAGLTIEIHPKGMTLVERLFYFVHLIDWISVAMANQKNIDASEIKTIDELKNYLSSDIV